MKQCAWPRPMFALLCLATIAACSETVVLSDGELAPDLPKQWSIESPAVQVGEFTLVPKAGYDITAKVLSKRQYRWDDLSVIAPWDFALGWGPLSDEAVLRPIKVVQGDRFMFWHLYNAQTSIEKVNQSSANVHLIPANDAVLQRIAQIPKGAIVRLGGELVDVHFPDESVIPSSLTRRDTGPGACEILLVSSVVIVKSKA